MKKHLLVLTALFLFSFTGIKAQLTFTIINVSGSNSITCSTPTINLLCITDYTSSYVTYTLSGPTGTTIGNYFPLTQPGIYSITAFATNLINSTQTLNIGLNTTPPFSAITPTTQNINCSFTSAITLTATANPTTNATHVFITPSGNSLAIAGNTAAYTPGVVGTHSHVLIDNTNGCKTTKIFLINSISGLPTLSLTCPQNFTLGCGSNSVCQVALTSAASSTNSQVSYTILNSGSSPGYVTNSQNLYPLTVPGTYTAIAHDNSTSCESRVIFSISSNTAAPNISLFTSTPTLSCNNPNSTLYGISTTPNITVAWGIPGSTLIPNTYSINVSRTGIATNTFIGTYSFTVLNNINACVSQTSIALYQNIFPPNALIGNAGSNSVTCTTPSVVLTNQSTSGIPASAFSNTLPLVVQLWSGPSTPTSAGNPSIAAFSAGVYSLTVLDPNNGCSGLATYTVVHAKTFPVVNNPSAPPPYCLDPPTVSVDLSPILGGAISTYTYAWFAPSSATISGQNTATLTTNTVGTYTVNVTNTVSGCSTEGFLVVTVCTGNTINSFDKSELMLYPNPSSGKFIIKDAEALNIQTLQVFNTEGKCIRVYNKPNSEMEFDIENEARGFYFIVLKNAEGKSYSFKLALE